MVVSVTSVTKLCTTLSPYVTLLFVFGIQRLLTVTLLRLFCVRLFCVRLFCVVTAIFDLATFVISFIFAGNKTVR